MERPPKSDEDDEYLFYLNTHYGGAIKNAQKDLERAKKSPKTARFSLPQALYAHKWVLERLIEERELVKSYSDDDFEAEFCQLQNDLQCSIKNLETFIDTIGLSKTALENSKNNDVEFVKKMLSKQPSVEMTLKMYFKNDQEARKKVFELFNKTFTTRYHDNCEDVNLK